MDSLINKWWINQTLKRIFVGVSERVVYSHFKLALNPDKKFDYFSFGILIT
ncbi:MAG: hypothetical protein PHY57_07010 [Ignavibacterium sp.]|jgi:hypothetical protein|nr:hypothetical protein [Ignavibacterium sp.]